jgi:hypothetical protein
LGFGFWIFDCWGEAAAHFGFSILDCSEEAARHFRFWISGKMHERLPQGACGRLGFSGELGTLPKEPEKIMRSHKS